MVGWSADQGCQALYLTPLTNSPSTSVFDRGTWTPLQVTMYLSSLKFSILICNLSTDESTYLDVPCELD